MVFYWLPLHRGRKRIKKGGYLHSNCLYIFVNVKNIKILVIQILAYLDQTDEFFFVFSRLLCLLNVKNLHELFFCSFSFW